jgi:hypothetical protein
MTVSLGRVGRRLQAACGIPEARRSTPVHQLDRRHVAEGLAEVDELVSIRTVEPLRKTLRDYMRHFSAFCDDVCNLATLRVVVPGRARTTGLVARLQSLGPGHPEIFDGTVLAAVSRSLAGIAVRQDRTANG